MGLAPDRKLMLLADLPPCLNYTGGVALYPLCSALPKDRFVAMVVKHPALTNAVVDPALGIKHHYLFKPNENAVRPQYPKAIAQILSRIQDWWSEYVVIPRLARKVVTVIRDEGITDIWCVLQGQTIVRLCNEVRRRTGLPTYTQVWDPIGWWLRSNQIDPVSTKRILAAFDEAISKSRAAGGASLPMAQKFASDYGIQTYPIILGLPASSIPPERLVERPFDRSEKFKVALSGQIYAAEEFKSLVAALDRRNWKLDGRDVEIHYFGSHFEQTKPRHFVDHGWLEPKELIPSLSKMDLLYCPYWFDRGFEEEARNSFPSKFITYLASGRPALFHGPAYSSAAKFASEQACAYTCLDSGEEAIGRVLDQVGRDLDVTTDGKGPMDTILKNARRAFLEYFTEDRMRQNFFSLLEVGYRRV